MLFGFLSSSGAVRWGAQLEVRPHTSQGEPILASEISLWHFSCHLLGPNRPSHVSSSLRTHYVVVNWFLLSVHAYKTFLQILVSWLFWTVSLQFSSNSSLVLGGT